jgi:hypothetical protein
VLSSLDALLKVLRPYLVLRPDRVRVFASSSREEMEEQLGRENAGLRSFSLTVTQFLQQQMFFAPKVGEGAAGGRAENQGTTSSALIMRRVPGEHGGEAQTLDEGSGCPLEQRRIEIEQGAGGDHDLPYRFTLPTWIPQVVAWAKLLTQVQSGTLQP